MNVENVLHQVSVPVCPMVAPMKKDRQSRKNVTTGKKLQAINVLNLNVLFSSLGCSSKAQGIKIS